MTQDEALAILKTGANVFLTGEPGSGKTHTINRYVAYLRSCGIEPAITASTGIAATHVGGMTVHSWSGIGVKNNITEEDLDFLLQKERLVKRMQNVRVLIIDEISMLSAETLSSVEVVARVLRHSSKPFGGIQVVFVGDFFQLPPILKRDRIIAKESQDDGQMRIIEDGIETGSSGTGVQFAFQSSVWDRTNPIVCYLSEQHRQEDEHFLQILSAIRKGEMTEEFRLSLSKRAVLLPENDTLTKLFPHNVDVDRINTVELGKLPDRESSFMMETHGFAPIVEGLKRNCLSPEKLALKVGAKVMFTKNSMEGKFVNGTLGEVVSFSESSGYPIIKTRNGRIIETEKMEWSVADGPKIIAMIKQIPLRLAWAITVHKSQGMSLDAALIDLRSAFEYGQGYVALSRLRTLQGLYLLGFNERSLEVHPEVSTKDSEFRNYSLKARQTFGNIGLTELEEMHENFLKVCGGKAGTSSNISTKKKSSTYDITKTLILRKLSIKDVAKERGVTAGTILSHLEKLKEQGEIDPTKDLVHLRPEEDSFRKMVEAFDVVFKKTGQMKLTPVRDLLGPTYDFDKLRLARLFVS